jgi:hypothetical protein
VSRLPGWQCWGEKGRGLNAQPRHWRSNRIVFCIATGQTLEDMKVDEKRREEIKKRRDKRREG